MIDRRSFLKTSLSAAGAAIVSPVESWRTTESVIRPKRLQPGDTVGIVSPAGITYDPDRLTIFQESLAALDLDTRVGHHALDRWGYLAGADDDRAHEINEMFADREIDAIFALAGGWGAARLLPLIDYQLVRTNPKIVMGFSDVTSLLIGLYARSGLVTFHGPTGNSTWNQFTADFVRRVLFDAEPVSFANPIDAGDLLAPVENRIHTIRGGRVRGRLVGGNLTVLTAIVGSDYLPDWNGHILFLEDVREDVYRVDRMLTQLGLAGVLSKISGLVFGRCSNCDPGEGYGSFTLKEVLDQHIAPLEIPAFYGSMIGHIRDKFTIPLGVEAQIDAEAGTIELLESAVL
jgi:muramoyltetrapeptide carboxypeptidase